MKAYLSNGITIEGTVAEIKEFFGRTELYNYNYSKYYSKYYSYLDLSFTTFRS